MREPSVREDLATVRASLPFRGRSVCECAACQAHRALDRLEAALRAAVRELGA